MKEAVAAILENTLATYLLFGFALLSIIVIAAAIGFAFVQDRSISLWPPKIGERKYRYKVNCVSCGQDVEVTNPRVHDRPTGLYTDPGSASTGDNMHGYRLGCPHCGDSFFVQFVYKA